MPQRMTVNQKVQLGVETTAGTSVAATKLMDSWTLDMGPKVETKTFRGTGRKHTLNVELNKEWVEAKLGGWLDYNSLVYLLSSAKGSITPAVHSPSTTAYDWVISSSLTGPITQKTYTIEQGDSVRAQKFGYGLITDLGYKMDRGDVSFTASMIGQAMLDSIVLTASGSVTPLLSSPVLGKHINVYYDSASGSLGTTQFAKPVSLEYSEGGIYAPAWYLNRTSGSFTEHVDLAPKVMFKMLTPADAAGMALLADLRADSTTIKYIRVESVGPVIDVTNSINATIWHDMAVRVANVSQFQDKGGIYAIEWTFEIVEDLTWAKAHQFTVTNLLTAL